VQAAVRIDEADEPLDGRRVVLEAHAVRRPRALGEAVEVAIPSAPPARCCPSTQSRSLAAATVRPTASVRRSTSTLPAGAARGYRAGYPISRSPTCSDDPDLAAALATGRLRRRQAEWFPFGLRVLAVTLAVAGVAQSSTLLVLVAITVLVAAHWLGTPDGFHGPRADDPDDRNRRPWHRDRDHARGTPTTL
jgi:hypothetical protein